MQRYLAMLHCRSSIYYSFFTRLLDSSFPSFLLKQLFSRYSFSIHSVSIRLENSMLLENHVIAFIDHDQLPHKTSVDFILENTISLFSGSHQYSFFSWISTGVVWLNVSTRGSNVLEPYSLTVTFTFLDSNFELAKLLKLCNINFILKALPLFQALIEYFLGLPLNYFKVTQKVCAFNYVKQAKVHIT